MTFLVSHHGSSRAIYDVTDFCDEHGMSGISPFYDAERFSSDDYQRGDVLLEHDEQGVLNRIRAIRGDPREPCYIYGFSAGGQYLSRVTALYPCTYVTRYVVGAPSTWVAPIRTSSSPYTTGDWPYGFGGLGLSSTEADNLIRAYLQLPLTVYCGEDDNDPGDADLGDPTNSLGQGAHRLARAQNVYSKAQSQATALSVTLNWTYVEAAGVGHGGTSMLNAAERNTAFGL